MKLAIIIVVILLVYFPVAGKLYKEFKNTPKEKRRDTQTVPLFLAFTFVCVALAVQLIRLSVRGILPLL